MSVACYNIHGVAHKVNIQIKQQVVHIHLRVLVAQSALALTKWTVPHVLACCGEDGLNKPCS